MITINFLALFNQIIILFILIFIGFIIKQSKVVDREFINNLATFIIYVTLPALIINSMDYDFSVELLINVGISFVITCLIYLLMIAVANLVIKPFDIAESKASIYRFLIIFANVGFMGYPVTYVLFGSEGVFLASIYNLVFNIMIWSIGVIIITSKDKSVKYFNYKQLLNPGIIAIVIGFSLFIAPFSLPEAIIGALEILGDSTIPLAMIVVGATLAQVKISSIFYDLKLWLVALLRLIILPAVVFLLLMFLPIDETVAGVIVLLTAMPAATNTAIFAQEFGGDTTLASKGIFLTTLLAIITVPLVAMFIV